MLARVLMSFLLVSGTGVSTSVLAQGEGLEVARTRNCLACHQVDQRRVGPSFTLIAERFAGQDGAQEYLAGAIRHGGRGRWGAVPMPAQPQVAPADAELIAAWILSLAEGPGTKP